MIRDGQILKIKFESNFAFLTQEVALELKQLKQNFPKERFQDPAYWTVKVLGFISTEKRLHFEVLDYNIGETEFSKEQIELTDILQTVEIVSFRSVDTGGLFKTMSGGRNFRMAQPKQELIYHKYSTVSESPVILDQPQKREYEENFSISIKNLTFCNGKVVFTKKIQQLRGPVEFQVSNEFIIEEFDAIKNYFSNVLKTKYIQVESKITTTNNEITYTEAQSKEISKINKVLIDQVKYELVKTARSKEYTGEKELFTAEEFLQIFTDLKDSGQKTIIEEDDLFEILLERSKTKHYNQLRYLSSKHNADLIKLRFVKDPFSFIFLISGDKDYFFIWETLDTQEATYIWSFEKREEQLNEFLSFVESKIKWIRCNGKTEYLNLEETNFIKILHDYNDQNMGFLHWKLKIEKSIAGN